MIFRPEIKFVVPIYVLYIYIRYLKLSEPAGRITHHCKSHGLRAVLNEAIHRLRRRFWCVEHSNGQVYVRESFKMHPD